MEPGPVQIQVPGLDFLLVPFKIPLIRSGDVETADSFSHIAVIRVLF